MNQQITVEQALDLVPGWDPAAASIEELAGGLTNRVYRVTSGSQTCVVRLTIDRDTAPGIDHRRELQILRSAAEAGIAPAILYSKPEAGILVTEYLSGKSWQQTDLQHEQNLERLASLLRRVHALPKVQHPMNPVGIAEKYAQWLESRDRLYPFAKNCIRIISDNTRQESIACCHNDVVASNVIAGETLRLVDWEYACDNDPLFDLASLIGFHDLAIKQQQILLKAYSGGADNALAERLANQIRVFDAIQWLWLATRQVSSPQKAQERRLQELQLRIG